MHSAPLIPYFTLPELPLVPAHLIGSFPPIDISIKPFGALVATGVLLGSHLTIKRAKRIGLDERVMSSFIAWIVGIGFVGGHVSTSYFTIRSGSPRILVHLQLWTVCRASAVPRRHHRMLICSAEPRSDVCPTVQM